MTFQETYDLARKFGSALVRMGAQKGDAIALILPNIIEFPVGNAMKPFIALIYIVVICVKEI